MKTIDLSIDDLRNMVDVLSSPEEKLRFLRSLSKTSNTAVLDLILELDEDPGTDTLEKGLKLALKKKDQDSILKYGRKAIDYYIENNFSILLPEQLRKWKNEKLTEYAVSKFPQSQTRDHLSEAVDFYERMKIENDSSKKLTEKLLAMEIRDSQYPFTACKILMKLGRHTEAIKHYLKIGEPYCLRDAWNIAREHVPEMKIGIAEKIWKMGVTEDTPLVVFVESALLLGYSERAIILLKKYIAGLKPNTGRFFIGLVEALKILDLSYEINKVLDIARKHTNSIHSFPWDAYKEMVQLCDVAGKEEESKQWMITRLKYEIAETNPTNVPSTIAEYEEKTGDKSLRILLFPHFEKQQMYGEAEKLAVEFGMPEKAEKYAKLAQLFVSSHVK
ncbi:MAG TPA: hypothetical protein PLO44_00875 [Candidatus Paceibacterota bacterium]|nr:hypothetical protein [Candidatus Paceibacterota bacterium]